MSETSDPGASASGSESRTSVSISIADFLWFVDLALDAMVSILRQLGDEGACRRPELDGANSAFAIATHCLGVMEYWGGAVVSGREIARDRDAEFRAEGVIEELIARIALGRSKLEVDLAGLVSTDPPRNRPHVKDSETPLGRTQGAVVLHIYEELAQHVGQMELTRDIVLSNG